MCSIDALVDCGDIRVDFFNDRVKTKLDPAIFSQYEDSFIVRGKFEDALKAATYRVSYQVSLAKYPGNSATSSESFSITVLPGKEESGQPVIVVVAFILVIVAISIAILCLFQKSIVKCITVRAANKRRRIYIESQIENKLQ